MWSADVSDCISMAYRAGLLSDKSSSAPYALPDTLPS